MTKWQTQLFYFCIGKYMHEETLNIISYLNNLPCYITVTSIVLEVIYSALKTLVKCSQGLEIISWEKCADGPDI